MEQQGVPDPTGMAKATGAFNLPSKHVFHTVGPIAQGVVTQADRALLANCYASYLDAAADLPFTNRDIECPVSLGTKSF